MNDEQILEQHIKQAAPEIKALLSDVSSWDEPLQDIARKNSLSSDQLSSLENEVLFVLVGLDLRDNLAQNIRDSVGVEPALAEAMAHEVGERILSKIEAYLPSAETPSAEAQGTVPTNLPTGPGPNVTFNEPVKNEPVSGVAPLELPSAPVEPTTATKTPDMVIIRPVEPKLAGPIYLPGKDPYREPTE